MDPNLFYLNWDILFEVFMTIIFLSFVIERALSLLFETEWYIKKLKKKIIKEAIAFVVSMWVCYWVDFDALSILFSKDKVHILGFAITGAIVAGGSKASIALFKDFWKIKSNADKRESITELETSKSSKGVK